MKSIMMYGAEIYGWEEREQIDKVQMKYIRWVLAADRNTPEHIIRAETQQMRCSETAVEKAIKFKIKGSNGEINTIRGIWREIDKGNSSNGFEKDRKRCYVRNGWSTQEVIELRKNREETIEKVKEIGKGVRMQELNRSLFVFIILLKPGFFFIKGVVKLNYLEKIFEFS